MKAIRFKVDVDMDKSINYYLDKGWTIFSIHQIMKDVGIGLSGGATNYTSSFLVIFNTNGIEL